MSRLGGATLREIVADAADGYGPYDREEVEAWTPVVALWAAAWGIVGMAEGLMWGVNARRRLDWLEATLPG